MNQRIFRHFFFFEIFNFLEPLLQWHHSIFSVKMISIFYLHFFEDWGALAQIYQQWVRFGSFKDRVRVLMVRDKEPLYLPASLMMNSIYKHFTWSLGWTPNRPLKQETSFFLYHCSSWQTEHHGLLGNGGTLRVWFWRYWILQVRFFLSHWAVSNSSMRKMYE